MNSNNETEINQEIRRLVILRDNVNDRLRSIRYKHPSGNRFSREVDDSTNTNKKKVDEPVKKSEGISVPSIDVKGKRNYETYKNHTFQGPEFEIEKRPKIVQDDQTQSRNRRMMSIGILGHLSSATAQLQKEKNSRRAQLQQSQEKKVELKLEQEKKNLIELSRKNLKDQAETIQLQLIDKENELTRLHLVKHYQNMKNFIGTRSSPKIFWLPSKFNDKTKILLQETINSIQEKIESIHSKDFSGASTLNNLVPINNNSEINKDEIIFENDDSSLVKISSSSTNLTENINDNKNKEFDQKSSFNSTTKEHHQDELVKNDNLEINKLSELLTFSKSLESSKDVEVN